MNGWIYGSMGRLLWDIRFKSLSLVVALLILQYWWFSLVLPMMLYGRAYQQ